MRLFKRVRGGLALVALIGCGSGEGTEAASGGVTSDPAGDAAPNQSPGAGGSGSEEQTDEAGGRDRLVEELPTELLTCIDSEGVALVPVSSVRALALELAVLRAACEPSAEDLRGIAGLLGAELVDR